MSLSMDSTVIAVMDTKKDEIKKQKLNAKLEFLKIHLKKKTEHYEKLKKERDELKEAYEKEVEESSDILAIAKRNLQQLASEILDLKERRRILRGKIEFEEKRLKKEEEDTRVQLAEEEEALVRDVVILQTKLLLIEEQKYERDKLLDEISAIEQNIQIKENNFEEEMKDLKKQNAEKFVKLSEDLNNRIDQLAEKVEEVSRAQQIVALKEKQEKIVEVQTEYRKAARYMLQLLHQNKKLEERKRKLKQELDTYSSLMEALSSNMEKSRKNVVDIKKTYEKQDDELGTDAIPIETRKKLLKEEIKRLKKELFMIRDKIEEINEILQDQERHKAMLSQKAEEWKKLQQKLMSFSDVADSVIHKGTVELPIEANQPLERHVLFEKLVSLLIESGRLHEIDWDWDNIQLQTKLGFTKKNASEYQEGLMGLMSLEYPLEIPKDTKKSKDAFKKKLGFSPKIEIGNDRVELKILNELGLLGKYYKTKKGKTEFYAEQIEEEKLSKIKFQVGAKLTIK